MPFMRLKPLIATFRARLIERGLLLPEQPILTLVAEKAGQLEASGAGSAADYSAVRDLKADSDRRLAELEGLRVNRIVFALHGAVLRLPAAIREPLRAALRGLLRPAPAAAAAAPAPAPSRTAAAAVPFGPAFPPPSLNTPLGVIMHVFYPELAAEMRAYLENIPGPVDLYISTDTAEKQARLERTFADWTAGRVQLRLAPNRGRDIAPKLVTWRDVYDRHAVVLHLHSKKSPHESHLRMWRYFLFENLMGEPAIAASILSALEHVPTLGMVASDHYFAVRNSLSWGDNLELAQGLAGRMGVRIDPHAALEFPSGSMFWAKSAALKPLLDLQLSSDDFPGEAGQKDGTLAHAVERLYWIACQSAGFEGVRVSRGRLADAAQPQPAPIGQVSDLVALLADRTPVAGRRRAAASGRGYADFRRAWRIAPRR